MSTRTQSNNDPYGTRFGIGSQVQSCLVHGKVSGRQLALLDQLLLDSDTIVNMNILATTQHAAVADALADTGRLWFLGLLNVTRDSGHGSSRIDQSDATHTILTNYSQPVAVSTCYADQFTKANETDHVRFPLLYLNSMQASHETNLQNTRRHSSIRKIRRTFFRHPNFFYRQISHASHSTVEWIDLPEEPFRGSSIGAIIKFPSVDSKMQSSQVIVVCNIAAGWSPGYLALKTAGSGITDATTSFPHQIPNKRIAQAYALDLGLPPAENSDQNPNWAPINISRSWAQYLNPVIDGLNRTVSEVLIQEDVNQEIDCARMISALVVNGLARTSWNSTLQGDVKSAGSDGTKYEYVDGDYWLSGRGDVFTVDPRESQDWATFRVDSTFQGYGYNAYTVPPRVAIAVMVLYCLLVAGHTIYSGKTGKHHSIPISSPIKIQRILLGWMPSLLPVPLLPTHPRHHIHHCS